MPKIVRTARGRQLDMAGLIARQEKTRAVSNVKQVNSRGDEIDAQGKIVKPVNQVVAESYASQVGNKGAQAQIRRGANPNAPMSPKQKRELAALEAKQKEEAAAAEKAKESETPLLDKLAESSQPVVTEEMIQPIEEEISPLPAEPPVIEDYTPAEEDAETELVSEDFVDDMDAMDIEAIKKACLDAQAVIDAAEEKKGDK